jgi:polygalacturonase
MDTFLSARRELLKKGGMGLAAAAVAAVPSAYAAPKSSSLTVTPNIFDIRTFGAVGDGKTVDSPAINKAIEAASAGLGRGSHFRSG